jgi:hypothetical protein
MGSTFSQAEVAVLRLQCFRRRILHLFALARMFERAGSRTWGSVGMRGRKPKGHCVPRRVGRASQGCSGIRPRAGPCHYQTFGASRRSKARGGREPKGHCVRRRVEGRRRGIREPGPRVCCTPGRGHVHPCWPVFAPCPRVLAFIEVPRTLAAIRMGAALDSPRLEPTTQDASIPWRGRTPPRSNNAHKRVSFSRLGHVT